MALRYHDLSDVTFVIPFSYDLPERLRNLRLVTEFILRHFVTNIIISEYDHEPKLTLDALPPGARKAVRHLFFKRSGNYFQRARSVNLAAREVLTPYLAICDTDVLLETRQYIEAASLLREGRCDMCLPFENRIMWIPSEEVDALESQVSDETLFTLNYELSDDSFIFLGLINFMNTRSFVAAGMMNENFKSWGYEEMELYIRLLKLGYRVLRTRGRAYHLGHGNGGETGPNHEYFHENKREYHRVFALNPDDLIRYIASWHWVQAERSRRHRTGTA
jgi:hypothetical protein